MIIFAVVLIENIKKKKRKIRPPSSPPPPWTLVKLAHNTDRQSPCGCPQTVPTDGSQTARQTGPFAFASFSYVILSFRNNWKNQQKWSLSLQKPLEKKAKAETHNPRLLHFQMASDTETPLF